MNRQEFETTVQTILDGLPEWVAAEMENVAVVVEHQASRDQDPGNGGILGLYEGVPLPERGIDYFGVSPDCITIFYEPHMTLGLPDSGTIAEIRRTVLHEIGHHFGFDDAQLHDLGWS